jgi:hypothetical protein
MIFILLFTILSALSYIYHYINNTKDTKDTKDKKYSQTLFLTYGNDAFKESRERIKKEAESLHIFDECIVETDTRILDDEEFKKALMNPSFKRVFESKRGGGYWIWKPYIVHKYLSRLREGDILVYCDAGCSIVTNNDNIINKINDLNNSSNSMILSKMERYPEKVWTKGDVLEYYGVRDNESIMNEGQYEGGRIIVIKTKNTMDIVDQWWKTARDHPELYDDSESKTKNDETFKENRHDQSNISILCKLSEECKGDYLDDVIKVTRIRK